MLKGSNYEVDEVLLDKGSQIVYRCYDKAFKEFRIVKLLRAEWSTYEEVMKFKREYNLLADLSQQVEGIPKPVRLEERGGVFILSMLDGGGRPLAELMANGHMSLEARLQLALRITETAGNLHDREVIHRNWNPATILYNQAIGELQLVDLDLAVKHAKEKTTFQNTGLIEGVLPYVSPEQTGRINRPIDYRSDFYALGVLFYKLFTGTTPHESGTMTEQIYSIIAKQPVSPHELTRGLVSRPLSDLIMRLLEKSPEDRYRSAYGIKADLRKCLNHNDSFEIGEEDKLDSFRLPQKLYGREKELDTLKAAFRPGGNEPTRLVLVSGEAGIGKTALVHELHRFIGQERGYFIQGKFDQYTLNLPYSAIIQAFRTLLVQLLNAEPGEIVSLRHALISRLGGNAALIVNLFPELQTLIGEQPALEPLNPTEETNRFFLSFAGFIEGLTDGKRSLVLFLDDWQWADLPSIQLMERLVAGKSLRSLLIIGAYRSDEIPPQHPFLVLATELEKLPRVQGIRLAALREEEIRGLIEDTFDAGPELSLKLSQLVQPMTKGNPFFVQELLKDLHKHEVVRFDKREGEWTLDQAKLQEMTLSDGVVNYLIQKMRTLPQVTQRILSLSASIGPLFDWKMLTLVSEEDSRVLAASLIQGVQEDIIVPMHPHYHVLVGMRDGHREDLSNLEIQFAFQHDKIQQALYLMIDPPKRQELHLKIGRLLLAHLSPGEIEKNIVEIASNLNQGIVFVTREDEIDRLISINLQAARKTKEAFGYETAYGFLETAIRLLPPDSWEHDARRTAELYRLYVECAYLTHRVEVADSACALLVEHVKQPVELAGIYEMQANHYTYLGLMLRSLEAGKRGLMSLGLRVPKKVGMGAVLLELMKVKRVLRGRSTEELLGGPDLEDQRAKLLMRLLVGFIPPAFISGEKNLFAWVVLKKAYLSAKYGNGPESAGAYTGYAILLSGLGDLAGSRDFGMLAVRLNEKFDDKQWRSLVLVLYTLFAHGWSHSWDTLDAWYDRAIDSSLKSGDLLYLAHASYYRNLWHPSMPIEIYLQESAGMLAMIEQTQYKESLATAKLAVQKFRILAGELPDPLSFDDEDFREERYLRQLTDANYYSGIAIYHVAKIQVLYTFGQLDAALTYIGKSYAYIGTLAGSAFMEEFSLYTYLTLAASYERLDLRAKGKARLRMRTEYARMRKWAKHAPDNFQTQFYMMKAERARLARRYEKADTYYHLALQSGAKGSFIRYKALSHELAAKYYRSRERSELAEHFLRQAAYYYSVWGAKGKVRQLERDYAELGGSLNRVGPSVEQAIAATSERIDMHAILSASQAISKEIGLDPLLDALMEIVIVNAGAQRGCIVMKSSSTMLVEGEYNPENDSIAVRKFENLDYDHFPKAIIDAIAENKETLLYDDASSEAGFLPDAYVARYKPKSLLCMPLMNQHQVTAIIYLENNLVAGAFTQERLTMIDLLSREMVYSLENASLYSDLERLVAERTEELALKNQQLNKYIHIVDNNVMIVQTNVRGIVTDVSEALCRSTGYRKEELIGQPHRFLQPSDNQEGPLRDFRLSAVPIPATGWRSELVQRAKDDSLLWLDIAIEPATERGRLTGYMFIGHNITDKKRIEQHSVTDDLTGLYNRRHFKDVFWREVKRAARNQDYLTFILLDIDYYKKYNDTYGHYEGDQVLILIGETINAQLRRAADFAFRLGGEEFGILYSGASPEHSHAFAERIRQSIEALKIPHGSSDRSRYVTVSVGLAVIGGQHGSMNEEEIYKLADEALYSSKAKGRNCVTMNVL